MSKGSRRRHGQRDPSPPPGERDAEDAQPSTSRGVRPTGTPKRTTLAVAEHSSGEYSGSHSHDGGASDGGHHARNKKGRKRARDKRRKADDEARAELVPIAVVDEDTSFAVPIPALALAAKQSSFPSLRELALDAVLLARSQPEELFLRVPWSLHDRIPGAALRSIIHEALMDEAYSNCPSCTPKNKSAESTQAGLATNFTQQGDVAVAHVIQATVPTVSKFDPERYNKRTAQCHGETREALSEDGMRLQCARAIVHCIEGNLPAFHRCIMKAAANESLTAFETDVVAKDIASIIEVDMKHLRTFHFGDGTHRTPEGDAAYNARVAQTVAKRKADYNARSDIIQERAARTVELIQAVMLGVMGYHLHGYHRTAVQLIEDELFVRGPECKTLVEPIHATLLDVGGFTTEASAAWQALVRDAPLFFGRARYVEHMLHAGRADELLAILNEWHRSIPEDLEVTQHLLHTYLVTGRNDEAIKIGAEFQLLHDGYSAAPGRPPVFLKPVWRTFLELPRLRLHKWDGIAPNSVYSMRDDGLLVVGGQVHVRWGGSRLGLPVTRLDKHTGTLVVDTLDKHTAPREWRWPASQTVFHVGLNTAQAEDKKYSVSQPVHLIISDSARGRMSLDISPTHYRLMHSSWKGHGIVDLGKYIINAFAKYEAAACESTISADLFRKCTVDYNSHLLPYRPMVENFIVWLKEYEDAVAEETKRNMNKAKAELKGHKQAIRGKAAHKNEDEQEYNEELFAAVKNKKSKIEKPTPQIHVIASRRVFAQSLMRVGADHVMGVFQNFPERVAGSPEMRCLVVMGTGADSYREPTCYFCEYQELWIIPGLGDQVDTPTELHDLTPPTAAEYVFAIKWSEAREREKNPIVETLIFDGADASLICSVPGIACLASIEGTIIGVRATDQPFNYTFVTLHKQGKQFVPTGVEKNMKVNCGLRGDLLERGMLRRCGPRHVMLYQADPNGRGTPQQREFNHLIYVLDDNLSITDEWGDAPMVCRLDPALRPAGCHSFPSMVYHARVVEESDGAVYIACHEYLVVFKKSHVWQALRFGGPVQTTLRTPMGRFIATYDSGVQDRCGAGTGFGALYLLDAETHVLRAMAPYLGRAVVGMAYDAETGGVYVVDRAGEVQCFKFNA